MICLKGKTDFGLRSFFLPSAGLCLAGAWSGIRMLIEGTETRTSCVQPGRAIVMLLALTLCVGTAAGVATAATLSVPGQYATIQDAIDAAIAGDVVEIADGTYKGARNKNLDFGGKAIVVQSASGDPSLCIIDCEGDGRGFYFHNNEGAGSVVTGLTITEGKVSNGGGGVNCEESAPTFSNCTILRCTAGYGGGFRAFNYFFHQFPTLTDCTIKDNTGISGGGGITCGRSPMTITNCTFSGNAATSVSDGIGGGFYFGECDPIVTDCTFTGNSAAEEGGGGYCYKANPKFNNCTIAENEADAGAGIYFTQCPDPALVDCTIARNNTNNSGAKDGGGIYCNVSDPELTGCAIIGNHARNNGGGLFCLNNSKPELTNCTVAGNSAHQGGGMYFYSSNTPKLTSCMITDNGAGDEGGGVYCYKNTHATLTNCTFAGNDSNYYGAALTCDSYSQGYPSVVTLTNCIFRDGTYQIWNWDGSTLTLTYCDVEGGWTGTGNIDADPLFADPVRGDYHITWNSPCRDAGDNSVVSELFDFEGDPRITNVTVDMGADEFDSHLYVSGRVVPGWSIDVKVLGYVGAPVTLFLGSGLADPPYSTQHGYFYLNWPTLWNGKIGTIPSNGFLVFTVTVPSSWTSGSEYPMQALVGPWGGAQTRLTNPVVLVVE
jgi:parallel beta-helix repeat protein